MATITTTFFIVAIISILYGFRCMFAGTRRRRTSRTPAPWNATDERRSDCTTTRDMLDYIRESNAKAGYILSGDYIEQSGGRTISWRNTLMQVMFDDIWLYYVRDYDGLVNGTAMPEFTERTFHLPDIEKIDVDVPPYDNVPAYMTIHLRRKKRTSRERFEFRGSDRALGARRARYLILHARDVCMARQYN